MEFREWFRSAETRTINEDFKTQRQKFISQGIQPEIVDRYIAWFKDMRDKKFKELFAPVQGSTVPSQQRNNIDAYPDFHQLEIVVDYVKGQRDIVGAKFTDVKFDGKPIYNQNGLEIYYADSPRACIQYKGNVPYSWCIARSDASNMFYTYRFKEHEPAFYFVKDIEKTKAEFGLWNVTKTAFSGNWRDKYHFFVVQVLKNADLNDPEKKQYLVTSAQNDGDLQMSWNDIIRIEPKLNGLQKVLTPKPLSPEDKADYKRFSKGVDDATFAKLDYNEKSRYLDVYVRLDKPLTDAQFQMLPEDLKNKYVGFGVGLSDAQYQSISQDKGMMKRYKEITLRKIEELLKNNHEIKLKGSEIGIFLENKPEEFFKKLGMDYDRRIPENLLSNINVETFTKLTPEQQKQILEKMYNWGVPTADPGMLEKLVEVGDKDYLTNEMLQEMIQKAPGTEAKLRIAKKGVEILQKNDEELPFEYLKAFMLHDYESNIDQRYLDDIGVYLAQNFEMDEYRYEYILENTNSEKLAHWLLAKYGKELSHDLLVSILNHVPNDEVPRLAMQLKDKLDAEDLQAIMRGADVEHSKLYNVLGHHAIVLNYSDGVKWVTGPSEGGEHIFYLLGPDQKTKVKLNIGENGAWVYSGGPSLQDLANKAFHAGKFNADEIRQTALQQYESPSKWNDYILDFMIKKPDIVKEVSLRGAAWSIGEFSPEQREKLFKARPDLMPPTNMKTSDGHIWVNGVVLGHDNKAATMRSLSSDDREFTLLYEYKPVLIFQLRKEGKYLARGNWVGGTDVMELFEKADKTKHSLATAEFIIHNDVEHFNIRGRDYGWKFTDMLPEHQQMVLNKFPDFLEPISLIKKLAQGNRPEMLSHMRGMQSMEMLDNDSVVIDTYHTISAEDLLNKRRFVRLPGVDTHAQQILDILHKNIGEGKYDFERLAKQGLEDLQRQFPFADEEMMNLAKEHGWKTSDAISHALGEVIMPKVMDLLYNQIRPFSNEEFTVRLKNNKIYFTTPFERVEQEYTKEKNLSGLEKRYKEWRKSINVDWDEFVKQLQRIERIPDKEAFKNAITGKTEYPNRYEIERY